MFEILVLIAFCWLFVGAIRLAFRVTWGLTKFVAVVLFTIALPILVGCLLVAGGMMLLVPLALVATAFGLLKACI